MTPTDWLADLTNDAFLGGAVRLTQPARGYRAGLDAVLLAASFDASRPRPDAPDRLLDVADFGAGVGAVGLCLAARCPTVRVHLIERDAQTLELTHHNVAAHSARHRLRVLAGDLAARASASSLASNCFDHVLANPPYFVAGTVRPPGNQQRSVSHVQPENDLDAWVRTMARTLRPAGTTTVIHRADGLPALLSALNRRFGGITVVGIHARAGQSASRVLVRATKGSRAPFQLASPLVLHPPAGSEFVPAISNVLRRPEPLCVWPD
ncbi:MAG: methyltransferase [Pseudomonadota bacterium]